MNIILLILFLLFTSNYCFGQSDTAVRKDSIYIVVDGVITNGNNFGAEYGKLHCQFPNLTKRDSLNINKDSSYIILDSKTVKTNFPQEDPNRIIDGVVTTNPINDSSKSVVPNGLLEEIVVLRGGFGAEYGTPLCQFPKIPSSKIDWYITHSIGFAPEESEPVFYIAVSKKITNAVYLGLKGGIYTFEADLDRAVNDAIQFSAPYNAGSYLLNGDFNTQGPSYIGGIYGSYDISNKISLNGTAGIRTYSENKWNGQISFSIPSNNYTPPEGTVTPFMNIRKISTENIIKPYFSLGGNYRAGKFEIGVFADNILSFGVNLGMGFN